MALNLSAKIPAVLARFAGVDPAHLDDKENAERLERLTEQITTALAVMLAIGVVLCIALLLGTA